VDNAEEALTTCPQPQQQQQTADQNRLKSPTRLRDEALLLSIVVQAREGLAALRADARVPLTPRLCIRLRRRRA
jgi:hypothetical protein